MMLPVPIAAATPLAFQYANGKPSSNDKAIRVCETTVADLGGTVYVYATFDMGNLNPVPYTGDTPGGIRRVTIGQKTDGRFTPAVRFGLVDDGRRAKNQVHLVPWISDGTLDYFGPHARIDTPYDLKLVLDLKAKRMTAWASGRGDEGWFMLAENVPITGKLSAINQVRIEQYPGSQGIRDLVIDARPSPEREAVRPHPLEKPKRVVAPGRGFHFQAMRSICRKSGRHVTIARDPTRWLGFPDVVQTGPESLICTYVDGKGHGGGGGLFVRHSHDLGKTWGKPTRVHASGVNCPRIQKLHDGKILLTGGTRPTDTVFYDSTNGGRTWTNQRWLRPVEAEPGGHRITVPSRVTELPDGSWLISGAWYPGMKAWEGTEGCRLEFFRSKDRGTTWKFHGYLVDWPPRSICEASILVLDDGRLLLYARECRSDGFPGIKALSDDMGKTWKVSELPFPVVGRTCAGFLKDGRVMLTFREQVGPSGLWAWVGDPLDETPYRAVGVHLNDTQSVGLKDGCLHIDNDGHLGQFTQYHLRPPDSRQSKIDFTVEAKVVANEGRAAMLSVPFVGKFLLFPDRIEVAHDRSLKADVNQDEFHTYRVIRDGNHFQLYVDGRLMIESKKADSSTAPQPWTPYSRSVYPLAFGNDSDGSGLPKSNYSISPHAVPTDVDSTVTGYSVWRRAKAVLEDPATGKRVISWSAARDGFPDQYLLDHVIEVDASVAGGDQGYSGWAELQDGRIFVVNYTDDATEKWHMKGNITIGGSWIRGTWLLPSDLPPRD